MTAETGVRSAVIDRRYRWAGFQLRAQSFPTLRARSLDGYRRYDVRDRVLAHGPKSKIKNQKSKIHFGVSSTGAQVHGSMATTCTGPLLVRNCTRKGVQVPSG